MSKYTREREWFGSAYSAQTTADTAGHRLSRTPEGRGYRGHRRTQAIADPAGYRLIVS